METKHTPGPWRTEFEQEEEFEGESDPTYGKLTVESELGCVALIGPLGPVKDDEDRANARLIAAAPEMAALLEDIADQLDRADTDEECGKAANDIEPKVCALLAKIKG